MTKIKKNYITAWQLFVYKSFSDSCLFPFQVGLIRWEGNVVRAVIKMSKPNEIDDQGEKTKLDYDKKTEKGELAVKVICLGDSAVGKSK